MSTTIQPVGVGPTITTITVLRATLEADGSIVCTWAGGDGSGNRLSRHQAAFGQKDAESLLAGPASSLFARLEAKVAAIVATGVLPPETLPTLATAQAAAARKAMAAGAAKAAQAKPAVKPA